ncbi:AI-2E family transporter [Tessaracoccus sp. OH4464_COT-324]|uniref:AI-2E family transporter n=1 Tax=Tessaracoccus sp. OH4464_COT-324 TaxID=2491059 RepID=UPI000F6382F3|nr:AI-2E family transporter [Tessaracoccus sp. OH4464_COT-324]RRD47897.1 AI-2E family transporter [Tessaracoccus sp. OH4464_COT-324]
MGREKLKRDWARRMKGAIAPKPVQQEEPVAPPPPVIEPVSGQSPFKMGFYGALGVMFALALSQALVTVQSILLLVLLAFMLALGASPLVDFLSRRVHHKIAVALVGLMAVGVVAIGVITVVPLLTEQATLLIRNLPYLLENLTSNEQISKLNERYGLIDRAQTFLRSPRLGDQVFNGVLGAGAVVVNIVFSAIMTLVLTLYFLASLDAIKQLVYNLAPASRRPRARYIANEIFKGVSGYIQGMGISVTIATVVTFTYLYIIGLRDYAVALSFMHGLLCFIPVAGAPTGAVIISVVAFTISPSAGIAAVVFFVIYQQLDAYFFYPTIMRRTVKVPGALVVLSAIIGGILLGVIGAVLAIPTAAALILLWKELLQPVLDAR